MNQNEESVEEEMEGQVENKLVKLISHIVEGIVYDIFYSWIRTKNWETPETHYYSTGYSEYASVDDIDKLPKRVEARRHQRIRKECEKTCGPECETPMGHYKAADTALSGFWSKDTEKRKYIKSPVYDRPLTKLYLELKVIPAFRKMTKLAHKHLDQPSGEDAKYLDPWLELGEKIRGK